MNKNDIVNEIANRAQLSKADAARALDATVETITQALKKGDDIRLVGFGTFHIAQRKATQGRNPRTGEVIQIAAARLPKFKAGKGLKDAVAR